MNDWFASGRAIDLVLVVLGLEALALGLWRRNTRAGPAPLDLIGQLLPGGLLLLALRCALTGAGVTWVALFVSASFPVHLFDLQRRWRRGRISSAPPPSARS